MTAGKGTTRQRVVEAAGTMLARHGLNATSIREMAKRAEAPFGSTYHHFPGGKQQVVMEAVTLAGAHVSERLERHLQAGAAAGLSAFLEHWRRVLLEADFTLGCPVMAAAAEQPIDAIAWQPLATAAQVFSAWEGLLSSALQREGGERPWAEQVATLVVASVEGAIVLCRAQRDIAPFDRVAAQLSGLVQTRPSAAAEPSPPTP